MRNGILIFKFNFFPNVVIVRRPSVPSRCRAWLLGDNKQLHIGRRSTSLTGCRPCPRTLNIDRPFNAVTLTMKFHRLFGNFEMYFEPTTQTPHTYKIDTIRTVNILRDSIFPVTRTLYLTLSRTIDSPSPRLLAIHRVCVTILHLSGAGNYINDILRDIKKFIIKKNEFSELGRLILLRAGD
jgi:hypothetical protein